MSEAQVETHQFQTEAKQLFKADDSLTVLQS